MFIYEITEYDRSQIMSMLQWAEWAIHEHIHRGEVDMSDEKREFSELWDHFATMEPSRLDEAFGKDGPSDIKADLADTLGE